MAQRKRAIGTGGDVPSYELFIGIDYSGAQTPEARLKALQVYVARPGALPTKELSPTASNNGRPLNWSRKEIAGSLIELARSGVPYLAGIDHGFSLSCHLLRTLPAWELAGVPRRLRSPLADR